MRTSRPSIPTIPHAVVMVTPGARVALASPLGEAIQYCGGRRCRYTASMPDINDFMNLPWYAQLFIVAGLLVFALIFRREFRAMVNVRMEAESCESSDVLRVSLEAENISVCPGTSILAWIVIEEHDAMTQGEVRNDYVDDDEQVAQSLGRNDVHVSGTHTQQARMIRVLQTKKIEPKELLQAQVMYHWDDRPLIRCRFSFRFYYWFGLRKDRRSVVKWFANPNPTPQPPAAVSA